MVRPRRVLDPNKNKRLHCPTIHCWDIDNIAEIPAMSNRETQDDSSSDIVTIAAQWLAKQSCPDIDVMGIWHGLTSAEMIEAVAEFQKITRKALL